MHIWSDKNRSSCIWFKNSGEIGRDDGSNAIDVQNDDDLESDDNFCYENKTC